MFEQYVVTADYQKKNKNDISLTAGDIIDVIERNDYGENKKKKWFIVCVIWRTGAFRRNPRENEILFSSFPSEFSVVSWGLSLLPSNYN